MSKQWKLGDVAMVTAGGVEKVAFRDCSAGWASVNDWQTDQLITSARPLLVIDPEDEAQVGALNGAIAKIEMSPGTIALQAALRALANPVTKPEEPTGLGAVAEVNGELWMRTNQSRRPWFQTGGILWRDWPDFPDTVTVLHEGYKP